MSQSRQQVYKTHLSSPEKPLRPILTLLNGDASWLMSFPRPKDEQASSGKLFFHVVFEPWLQGDATMLGAWFFNITSSAKPDINDVAAVERVIREIEDAAACHLPPTQVSTETKNTAHQGNIDAILLSFHYLDHIHKPTLLTFDPRIPVIATPEAAAIIKPWSHFTTISLSHDLDSPTTVWKSPDLHPENFPDWLTVLRMPGHAELNFCTALIWSHQTDTNEEIHETIIISPHGTRSGEGPLDGFLNAEPKTEMLTLLHGLKEGHSALSGQTKLGAKGGLALYRKIGGAKSWILNHDNDFKYAGLFLWVNYSYDLPRSMEWALEEEQKEYERSGDIESPNFIKVGNGGAVVL
ncbi:hypothetical protein F53441_10721 [Fusarium austroafricanum]|uniref:Uncharacterized protein n=1 Tax=Fusarium austroafricanum TaxID=2364996 RepID=A0A8H4K9U9_9HYPO|nr:hypothetical protein F53441_10721 [Fusarium austroafricanum]